MSTLELGHVPASDLVATALLGTARRAVPAGSQGPRLADAPADPAVLLLDLAALNRVYTALTLTATEVESGSGPAEPCPAEPLPLAPAPAQHLLLGLLGRPEPLLLNSWLELCARHEFGVSPELWTRLARVAARYRRVDRQTLGSALGPQGRWFLRQNPEWAKLATDASAAASDPVRAELPAEQQIEAYERLRIVVDEALRGPNRLAGARALNAYDALAATEAAMYARLEIEVAFDPTRHVERVSLPDRRELAQYAQGGSA
jgi:hypothetical protein